jgi:hypothetical protein
VRRRDVIQAQYQYKAALEGLCRLIGADLTPALPARKLFQMSILPWRLPNRFLPFEEALSKAMLGMIVEHCTSADL